MALQDWVLFGGVALLLRHGLKKRREDKEYDEWFTKLSKEVQQKREAEWNRRLNINLARKSTPCKFRDGLTYDDFRQMAEYAGRKIRRVIRIRVQGPLIDCEVESQTGYSTWYFQIDFNDWGHITGTYWIRTDNDDSSIPDRYGELISREIGCYLNRNNIPRMDYSGIVDSDPDIGNDEAFRKTESFLSKVFRKKANISTQYEFNELYGEHLYFVIAFLKRRGFCNIQVIPIKTFDDYSPNYIYEVDSVQIQENKSFGYGDIFHRTSKILVYYYAKREISVPFSESYLRHRNCDEVQEHLRNYGFVWIEKERIRGNPMCLLRSEGSVEQVLIGEKEPEPMQADTLYPYDTRIVIMYFSHAFTLEGSVKKFKDMLDID